MSLRTPADNESRHFQGTIFLQSSFPRTRESRFVLAQLAWIPAFAGMTEPHR